MYSRKAMQPMTSIHYRIVHSSFGELGVVWRKMRGRAKVIRILLPRRTGLVKLIHSAYPDACSGTTPSIERLSLQIKRFCAGARIKFSVAMIDRSQLYEFQKKVLMKERQVGYGRVTTYGRLAAKIDHPRAARAVGTALARNPFPIIIPCHRTIREDGTLGGYGGGISLKKKLLEQEGIRFTSSGKVIADYLW